MKSLVDIVNEVREKADLEKPLVLSNGHTNFEIIDAYTLRDGSPYLLLQEKEDDSTA